MCVITVTIVLCPRCPGDNLVIMSPGVYSSNILILFHIRKLQTHAESNHATCTNYETKIDV